MTEETYIELQMTLINQKSGLRFFFCLAIISAFTLQTVYYIYNVPRIGFCVCVPTVCTVWIFN